MVLPFFKSNKSSKSKFKSFEIKVQKFPFIFQPRSTQRTYFDILISSSSLRLKGKERAPGREEIRVPFCSSASQCHSSKRRKRRMPPRPSPPPGSTKKWSRLFSRLWKHTLTWTVTLGRYRFFSFLWDLYCLLFRSSSAEQRRCHECMCRTPPYTTHQLWPGAFRSREREREKLRCCRKSSRYLHLSSAYFIYSQMQGNPGHPTACGQGGIHGAAGMEGEQQVMPAQPTVGQDNAPKQPIAGQHPTEQGNEHRQMPVQHNIDQHLGKERPHMQQTVGQQAIPGQQRLSQEMIPGHQMTSGQQMYWQPTAQGQWMYPQQMDQQAMMGHAIMGQQPMVTGQAMGQQVPPLSGWPMADTQTPAQPFIQNQYLLPSVQRQYGMPDYAVMQGPPMMQGFQMQGQQRVDAPLSWQVMTGQPTGEWPHPLERQMSIMSIQNEMPNSKMSIVSLPEQPAPMMEQKISMSVIHTSDLSSPLPLHVPPTQPIQMSLPGHPIPMSIQPIPPSLPTHPPPSQMGLQMSPQAAVGWMTGEEEALLKAAVNGDSTTLLSLLQGGVRPNICDNVVRKERERGRKREM